MFSLCVLPAPLYLHCSCCAHFSLFYLHSDIPTFPSLSVQFAEINSDALTISASLGSRSNAPTKLEGVLQAHKYHFMSTCGLVQPEHIANTHISAVRLGSPPQGRQPRFPQAIALGPAEPSRQPQVPRSNAAAHTCVCSCRNAVNTQYVLIIGGLLTLAWSFPFFDIAKNLLLKTPRIPTIP